MHTPDQALRDRPARIAEAAMHHLARNALRVRNSPVMSDVGAPALVWPSGVAVGLWAIVTVAITPCVGTTPGTGKVQLYTPAADTDGDDGAGNTVVMNWATTSGTIAVGKHCKVSAVSGFGLGLDWFEC